MQDHRRSYHMKRYHGEMLRSYVEYAVKKASDESFNRDLVNRCIRYHLYHVSQLAKEISSGS